MVLQAGPLSEEFSRNLLRAGSFYIHCEGLHGRGRSDSEQSGATAPITRRQWRSEPHNLTVFLVGKCCSEEPNQQRVIRLGITTCIHSMHYYSSVRDDLLCAVHLFMLSLHMMDKQTDSLPAIRVPSVCPHCVSRVFSIQHISLELDDLNVNSS